MKDRFATKLTSLGAWLVAAIIVLVPFHAFLSVWIGSSLGVYDGARLWKELVLVLLAVVVGLLLWRDGALRKRLCAWPIFWLVVAYIAVQLIMAAVSYGTGHASLKAVLYALIINLRFVFFFLFCVIIAVRSPWLRAHWRQLILVPAGLVVGFGLLQATVLPRDFLAHFGYGPETIVAYQTVDQKSAYVRAQSTLRGPNPLGAYLVVVIAIVAAVLIGQRVKRGNRWLLGALFVGATVVLGYSYSRSAYIGAVVAVAASCWLLIRGVRARRLLLVVFAGLLLISGALFLALRQNDYVQNVLFHTDEQSLASRSSNQDRAEALQHGLHDLAAQPLGQGLGTAGPASVYNNGQANIAENYYLQIGQEAGWLGLGLFVALLATIGWQLVRQRPDTAAVALVASLAGICLVSLVSHAWADDTLGLLWWGLAGIVVVPAILGSTRNDVR